MALKCGTGHKSLWTRTDLHVDNILKVNSINKIEDKVLVVKTILEVPQKLSFLSS